MPLDHDYKNSRLKSKLGHGGETEAYNATGKEQAPQSSLDLTTTTRLRFPVRDVDKVLTSLSTEPAHAS